MSKMISMPAPLVAKCADALPEWFRMHMEQSPEWYSVAGGFCRDIIGGYPVKDIDVFTWGRGALDKAYEVCEKHCGTPHTTARSHTFTSPEKGKPPVSLILDTNIYPLTRAVHFDFECCACSIHFVRGKWDGYVSLKCLEDIEAKRLTYTGASAFSNENGIGSMIRAFRFAQKGWSIDTENLVKIGGNIQEKALSDNQPYEES